MGTVGACLIRPAVMCEGMYGTRTVAEAGLCLVGDLSPSLHDESLAKNEIGRYEIHVLLFATGLDEDTSEHFSRLTFTTVGDA